MRGKFAVSVAAMGLALATTMAAPAQADDTDDIFISVLDEEGITYTSKVDAVRAAYSVCEFLLDGNTLVDATSEVSDSTDLSIEDAGFFVGAASASYCPSEAP